MSLESPQKVPRIYHMDTNEKQLRRMRQESLDRINELYAQMEGMRIFMRALREQIPSAAERVKLGKIYESTIEPLDAEFRRECIRHRELHNNYTQEGI